MYLGSARQALTAKVVAAMAEYEEKGEPAIRASSKDEHGYLTDYSCPYCGGQSLLTSYGDIPDDRYRVEVYCDNPSCVIRTMAIVALRSDSPLAHERADVKALRAVDNGTEEEQEEEGYELIRDERGEVIGRGISAGQMNVDFGTSALSRRERATKIRVEPDDP